jgi:hypothetical protein
VGIEVKASRRYRRDFAVGLRDFHDRKLIASAHLVYDGPEVLRDGKASVLPLKDFPPRLAAGDSTASS